MAALNHAVNLPKLKLGKVGRFDRDRRVVRRNDLDSVAVIDARGLGLNPRGGRRQPARGRRPRALTPFYERFEVVKALFQAFGIHALNYERIGDPAERAARQRVLEGGRQACSIAFRGELPASAPRQQALHL